MRNQVVEHLMYNSLHVKCYKDQNQSEIQIIINLSESDLVSVMQAALVYIIENAVCERTAL